MGRALKWVAGIVAAIVVLLIVVAVIASLLFDPNDYKAEISQAVKDNTSRDLEIEGDLSLELFPWLRVAIGEARLSNATGFGDAPFAQIESAQLSLKLLPLLARNIEVGGVSLEKLRLNLAVDKSGRSNWDDLAGAGSDEAESPPGDDDGSGVSSLRIGRLQVNDAEVSWTDASADTAIQVTGFNLTTGALEPGEPFSIELEFTLDSAAPAMTTAVELSGEASADVQAGSYQVRDMQVDLQSNGEGLPDSGVSGEFSVDALDLSLESEKISLQGLVARLFDVEFRGDLSGTSIVGNPSIAGAIEIEPFSLRDLLGTFGEPPVTNDDQVLKNVAGKANLAYDSQGVALNDLVMVLDDSNLRGSVALCGDDMSRIAFDLELDSIALDRYMAPSDEEVPAEEEEGSLDSVEIPADAIRALNIDGRAKVGEARFSGMLLSDLDVGLTGGGGRLRISPLKANFYGGSYNGDINIDARSDLPRVWVNEALDGVELAALAADLAGLEQLTGSIEGRFELSASGATVGAMKERLNGNLSFALNDGVFEDTDIWYELRRANALLRQQPVPEREGPERTEFSQVSGTATVTDGLLRSNDLVAALPFLRLSGGGEVNIPTSGLDLSFVARVLESPELSDQGMDNLAGKSVPVTVTGTVESPKVRPDVGELVKERAKEEIKDAILDKLGLGGGDEPAEGEEGAEGEEEEDPLKKLKKLFR